MKTRKDRDAETIEGSSIGRKRSAKNESITQRLNRLFDGCYGYYTVAIPFNTIVRPRFKTRSLTKLQGILLFSRDIVVKAQMFINYYIMTNCNEHILGEIFNQNF